MFFINIREQKGLELMEGRSYPSGLLMLKNLFKTHRWQSQ